MAARMKGGSSTSAWLGVALVAGMIWLICDHFNSSGTDSGNWRVEGDFNSITSALKLYKANNGRYPTESEGLKALVENPGGADPPRRWTRLMDRVPTDPWGNPYRLEVKSDGKTLILRSLGPDGIVSADDETWVVDAPEPK